MFPGDATKITSKHNVCVIVCHKKILFLHFPSSSSRLPIFLVSLTQCRIHSLLNFFSLRIVLLLSSCRTWIFMSLKTCIYPQYSVPIIDSKLIKVLIEETSLLVFFPVQQRSTDWLPATHRQKPKVLVLDRLEHRLLREIVDARQAVGEHAVHVADLPGEPHGGDDGGHAVAHCVPRPVAALHHPGHRVTVGHGGVKLLKKFILNMK